MKLIKKAPSQLMLKLAKTQFQLQNHLRISNGEPYGKVQREKTPQIFHYPLLSLQDRIKPKVSQPYQEQGRRRSHFCWRDKFQCGRGCQPLHSNYWIYPLRRFFCDERKTPTSVMVFATVARDVELMTSHFDDTGLEKILS